MVKNVIARTRGDIKAILKEEAHRAKSWFEFKRGAEGATWMAFPERILHRWEGKKNCREENLVHYKKVKQNIAHCLIHGSEIISQDNLET